MFFNRKLIKVLFATILNTEEVFKNINKVKKMLKNNFIIKVNCWTSCGEQSKVNLQH